MKLGLAALLFCCALSLEAQTEMNIDQLAQFVRSELALKQHTDKQIAAYLGKQIRLTEKLSDKTIEDLQEQGAGPRTVEALKALADRTATLKAPTPATTPAEPVHTGSASLTTEARPVIPPPDSVHQQEILDEIRQYAMSYTQNLPNFICLQVTRRYADADTTNNFHLIQTINAQLNYHDGAEEHRVISVNGKLSDAAFTDVGIKAGGAISTGEFGGMLRSIFEPHSEATFDWDHWATWHGKRAAVFHYAIDSAHSDYHITYDNTQQIVTAYRGLVYADPNTGAISHITLESIDIPKSFPINEASEILDFGDVEIDGKKYICPLKAELHMRSGGQKDKNDIEFRLYRKFGTESNIVYGAEAPPPLADNPKEEPPAATPVKQTSNPWNLPTPPPPPK